MFPDFSQFGKSIDTLSEKFDRIIQLLEKIEKNTDEQSWVREADAKAQERAVKAQAIDNSSTAFNSFPLM